MKIWNSLNQAKKYLTDLKINTAVTIGNFDGVHQGHQVIIQRTINLAREISGQAVAISFASHTDNAFGQQPPLLNQPVIRRELLAKMGLDALLEIEFDQQFAALLPEVFFQTWLVAGLKTRGIVVGYDFRFGSEGRGDFKLLQNLSSKKQIIVEQIPPVSENGEIISSSKIRQLIATGNIELANKMLGYPFVITGEVVPGEQRGRNLGFPTANIHLEPTYLLPAFGVYLVDFEIVEGKYYGVANVGLKPTFGVALQPLTEVHLFGTTIDLYQKQARIRFLSFIRPEIRFKDSETLKRQISADVKKAQELLTIFTGPRSIS